MLKVFITVDTEVWPDSRGWPHAPLPKDYDAAREIAWYFYGGGGPDARGIPYQLRVLEQAGLKATFFVDPLFSFALGVEPLRQLVHGIRKAGQEIGLHLHPEWLTDPRCPGLPAFRGPILHQYGEHDQVKLVQAGLDRLRDAGAENVIAFRAGSWGANLATLRALGHSGIRYDSSLNARFATSFPDLDEKSRDACAQPVRLENLWEFPVTTFVDRPPEGRRPLHVCAASLGEFQAVLEHAAANNWFAAVIVLHSFEFVRVNRLPGGKPAAPQRLIADRFERLCAYLAAHSDKYETSHFADLDASALPADAHLEPAGSTRVRTALRNLQQLASRFY